MAKQTGFTLIELMIAVIVVGILTAIALPSYQSYVRRAACENTKSVLVGAGNVMERFRAQNNTYSGADLGSYAASPVDGSDKDANIAVTAADATSYTLTATPTSGGRLKNKGTLTLTSAGVRGGTGDLASKWGSCNGI